MISQRLQTIASMIRKGVCVADIGTDHALLPIYLIENNIAQKVYACDISPGPLQQAVKNIEKAALGDSVIPVLSDGFANVPKDIDTAVIAGMGFYTARAILEEAGERINQLSCIITEVNQDVDLLRMWISDHHYTIHDEEMIFEKGFYYTILSWSCAYAEPLNEKEILIGPILSRKRPAVLLQYAEKESRKMEMILQRSKKQTDLVKAERLLRIWKAFIEDDAG